MGNSFVAPVEPFQNGDISHFVVAPSGVKGNFTFVGQKIDSPLMQTIFKFIQQYSKKQIEMKSMPEEEWVVKISLKEQIWHNFKDSFRQRVLWTQLFKACHQHGFKPLMNTDMQRYDNIQNFEVFEKTLEPPPAALAVVSLSSYDSLQLVSDAGDHEVLLNSLVAIINENWKLADIKVKEKSDDGPKNLENFKCTDIDLGKSPWGHMAGAATLTAARFLLCHIASKLAKESGWSLYTCANVKGHCDYLWFGKNSLGSDFNAAPPSSNQPPPAYSPFTPLWDLPPPPQYFPETFGYQARFIENREPGLISLSSDDKLRVCGFSDKFSTVHQIIRDSATLSEIRVSSENVNEFSQFGNGIEFKFKGSPWWCSKQKAVRTRVLFLKIFEGLTRQNYRVLCSLDTSRKLQDKSSFVVVPTEENMLGNYSNVRSIAICASDVDHLRIVGDYTDGELKEILEVIGQSAKQGMEDNPENFIDETLNLGMMSKNWRSHFIKFKGWVWCNWTFGSYSNKGGLAVMMVGNIVSCLRRQGWELVCQADVSAKFRRGGENQPDYKVDVDTWYFIKVDN